MITPRPTAEICDDLHPNAASCDTQFRNYGGRTEFAGRLVTVRCIEDNALVKEILNSPGEGRVLLVDAQANMHCAMVGDQIAAAAVKNGWAGVIVNGCIRDSAEIATLDIAVKALGTNPRKSAKTGIGARDIEIALGGVTFTPGHVAYGDADGIVVHPDPVQ